MSMVDSGVTCPIYLLNHRPPVSIHICSTCVSHSQQRQDYQPGLYSSDFRRRPTGAHKHGSWDDSSVRSVSSTNGEVEKAGKKISLAFAIRAAQASISFVDLLLRDSRLSTITAEKIAYASY